jgi:hypothetical protein
MSFIVFGAMGRVWGHKQVGSRGGGVCWCQKVAAARGGGRYRGKEWLKGKTGREGGAAKIGRRGRWARCSSCIKERPPAVGEIAGGAGTQAGRHNGAGGPASLGGGMARGAVVGAGTPLITHSHSSLVNNGWNGNLSRGLPQSCCSACCRGAAGRSGESRGAGRQARRWVRERAKELHTTPWRIANQGHPAQAAILPASQPAKKSKPSVDAAPHLLGGEVGPDHRVKGTPAGLLKVAGGAEALTVCAAALRLPPALPYCGPVGGEVVGCGGASGAFLLAGLVQQPGGDAHHVS